MRGRGRRASWPPAATRRQLERYLLYGSEDATACMLAEKHTFDTDGTGRSVVRTRVER